MDICSFKPVSRGGNRHWLIVVDEFSDCIQSFFLKKEQPNQDNTYVDKRLIKEI